MSGVRLRARSVTEIVDAAFQLYRQQPMVYIMAAAIGNVPSLIGSLLLQRGDTANPMAAAASGIAGVVLMLVSVVGYALMSAVVARVGSQAYLGEPADLAAAVRDLMPLTLTVLVASILRTFLYGVSMLLLFFPFLWVFARYFAVIPVLAIEKTTMSGSFTRSAQLAKGRMGHILGTMFLVWALFSMIVMGMGIFAAVGMVFGQTVFTLLTTLITIVVYPVIALSEVVLYYDARIRGEGFDLERMASDLGGVPAGGTSAA